MAKTLSTMLPLGTLAPEFDLPNVDQRQVSKRDYKDCAGLLVIFICNHCPYVVHVRDTLRELGLFSRDRNIGMVAINSNDPVAYPDDHPDKMADFSKSNQFSFPYLFDATQEVAKAYTAACTPDLFLFNHRFELYYRGQMDSSRPGNEISSDGSDAKNAMEAMLKKSTPPADQRPSIGCNIKWKPGEEPDYFYSGSLA